VKERRKPDRPWQNGEIGGGLPTQTNLPRKRRSGSTCRWKAPGIGETELLDGRVVKVVLAVFAGSASVVLAEGGDVGVRGHSSAPPGSTRPVWSGTARRSPTLRAPRGDGAGFIVSEWAEAEAARRQACPQPGLDRRKTVWRRTGEPDLGRGGTLRLVRRKPRARKSSVPRVLVSRVGCRGRSRSTLSTTSRGAARQAETAWGSTERKLSPDEGRDITLRAKRVRGAPRERNWEREALRSVARSRSRPTEGVLGSRRHRP
jgi:hypothetical protein